MEYGNSSLGREIEWRILCFEKGEEMEYGNSSLGREIEWRILCFEKEEKMEYVRFP